MSSNKNFGIVFSVFFLLIFVYFYIAKETFNIVYIIFSLLFLILGFINSGILTPLNFLWTKFGDYLAMLVSPCIMFFLYFGIIFPTKIFLFTIGKDILSLKVYKNAKSKSYWNVRKSKIQKMDNQF